MGLRYMKLALALSIAAAMAPESSIAGSLLVDTRAAAIGMNLSGTSYITTGGYYAPGDGGGANYRNVGAAALLDVDASFTDAGGNNWQYSPSGQIYIRQFGAKCDWNIGQDSARAYATYDSNAADDAPALQNAIAYAARQFANGNDVGGGSGATVRVPKGACKIGTQVRVADQVVVTGEGPLSSVLIMPQSFDPSKHFIVLGNNQMLASFGSRIEDLQLWSVNSNAAYNTAMLYSNNTQHTGGVFRTKIFAGNRSAIYLQSGFGGASIYYMEHVETYNIGGTNGANNNPGIILSYSGSLISSLRNVVSQGPSSGGANHIALRIDGGQVEIDGFHTEGVAIGIDVHVSGGVNTGFTRLRNLTGGNGCSNLVQIESFVAPDTTVIGMAAPNGCSNQTVLNGISGAPSYSGVLIDDRKF